MRWSELVDRVREYGRYPDDAESRRVIRTVLWAMGGHLPHDVRDDLARRLPEPAAESLTDPLPVTRQLTGSQFVDDIARRIEGATAATARWDVSSVLGVVADLAGHDLVDRILATLPPGYALLFGRAELAETTRRRHEPGTSTLRRVVPSAGPRTASRAGALREGVRACRP